MTEEQKAEEYTNNLLKDVTCNIGHPRARQINSIDIQDAWLDGYHECQKEHEWHYVKDGDLPKDMENVLINAFDYGINTCYVAHRFNGKWKSNCSSEIFVHVIKWKEIE